MNNINLRCPMPRCNHVSHNQFELLQHLNSNTSHPTTLHLADRSTCIQHNIFQCCQYNCPTSPTRFFRTLHELHQHNTTHHPPPTPSTITLPHTNIIEPNAPQIPPSSTDIATTIIFSLSRPGAVNNWSSGINFIIELQQQPYVPPDFRNTWRRHLRHESAINPISNCYKPQFSVACLKYMLQTPTVMIIHHRSGGYYSISKCSS